MAYLCSAISPKHRMEPIYTFMLIVMAILAVTGLFIGVMNAIAQKVFRKPRISYVHLDETGSFLWPLIDGRQTVCDLAGPLKERFGEAAEPLYPRIAKYFQILQSYGFVTMMSKA